MRKLTENGGRELTENDNWLIDSNEATPASCSAWAAWGVFLFGNWFLYLNDAYDISFRIMDWIGLWAYFRLHSGSAFNFAVDTFLALIIAGLFIHLMASSNLGKRYKTASIIIVLLIQLVVAAFCWLLWQLSMVFHH